MKNQALFSSKDKSKKLKCRLLRFLFSALRVKSVILNVITVSSFARYACKLKINLENTFYYWNLHEVAIHQYFSSYFHSHLLFPKKIFLTICQRNESFNTNCFCTQDYWLFAWRMTDKQLGHCFICIKCNWSIS